MGREQWQQDDEPPKKRQPQLKRAVICFVFPVMVMKQLMIRADSESSPIHSGYQTYEGCVQANSPLIHFAVTHCDVIQQGAAMTSEITGITNT